MGLVWIVFRTVSGLVQGFYLGLLDLKRFKEKPIKELDFQRNVRGGRYPLDPLTLIDRCEVFSAKLNASAANAVGRGRGGEGAIGAQRQKPVEHIVHFVEDVR